MAIGAVALTQLTEASTPHDGKAQMDQNLSTKELGLVAWQYFFQKYVDAKTNP